ncbi:MAG: protein jag [Oscillospiraceae bacterium]|nr:protein jag [Oscillospiraceae bacterium]
MLKTVEKTGKTEEEAIQAALAELGCEREQAEIQVLERAKSGFFGIGSAPAKVRVSIDLPQSKAECTVSFLEGLFERMGVQAGIELTENPNGSININLTGDNMGALIGRRGETLDAIQHLANYAVNRGGEQRVRINVDTENYRAKRTDALVRLAKKVAAKVIKYRRNVTLEPMNAYERHVIHTALQDVDSVTTYSTGTEPNRRVVVAYDRQGSRRQPESKFTSREWS